MTAHEIALTLMADRYRRNFCLPHYTPFGWFECDVFEVSESGYFKEYEIKVSRMDFFRDREKSRRFRGREQAKYEMIEAGDPKGPTNFTYVMPEGLVKVEELPEWAGLIEVSPRPGHRVPWSVGLRRVKDGRRLHMEKVNPKVWSHARGVCYYRLHQSLTDLSIIQLSVTKTNQQITQNDDQRTNPACG